MSHRPNSGDPLVSDRFPTISPITVAHEAQNALTAVQLRLQLVRRRVDQGDIDIARILMDIDDIDDQLRDGIALVGTLQVGLIYADDAAAAAPRVDG
jgi:hypothetical protein